MTNDERITALAQSIYLARHNQQNGATGADLVAFQDEIIGWVNQFIPEIQAARNPMGKAVDWNFVRTNDDPSVGVVTDGAVISYPLPIGIRKLVINPHRDLTIRFDGSVISSFKLVNPNQAYDPTDNDVRSRATTIKRKIIFSRPLTDTEVGGTITADTLAYIPQLSHDDVSLLDMLDLDLDIRQLFVAGVVKNQILPDIVQGGLTPSYSGKFDELLASCIAANDESADADDVERESFSWISGVGY